MSESYGRSASAELRTDVAAYLKDVSTGPLLYCPNPGNAGDSAIAAATYQMLDRLGIAYRTVRWDEKIEASGHIIVYGGGGNLTSDYANARYFIERNHCQARRLILLPHTVQGHADLLRKIGSNVDIFCRERRSYAWVCNVATEANAYLANDMAFHLDPSEYTGLGGASGGTQALSIMDMIRRSMWKRYGAGEDGLPLQLAVSQGGRALAKLVKSLRGGSEVLYAMRTDMERRGGQVPSSNVDLSQVFRCGTSSPAVAQRATRLLFSYLDRFDRVVTNRLHLCILAALLGKEVDFYANSYFKNEAVFAFSIKGRFPQVQWCGAWSGADE